MRRYPWNLSVRLAACVESCQARAAHETLERVLRIIAGDRGGLGLRKLRCAQHLSFCLRGAHKGGAPSDEIVQEHLRVLERLADLRTWRAVAAFMHRYVDKLIARVRPLRRTSVEHVVNEMRWDMRATLEEPKSLAEYAQAASLSTEYLSRSFTKLAGQSFRAERRKYRMEEARDLLANRELKIAVIAARVGLRDPSQLVADFRKEYGQTPGAYRTFARNTPKQRA